MTLPPCARCLQVQQLYLQGHEIACHTFDHVGDPSAEEILSGREWLSNQTGIPLHKINGFRSAGPGAAGLLQRTQLCGQAVDPEQQTRAHGAPAQEGALLRHCIHAAARRTPFLNSSANVRRTLFENGFLYDSSLSERFPSPISPDAAHRTWPYTFDAGIAQNINIGGLRPGGCR